MANTHCSTAYNLPSLSIIVTSTHARLGRLNRARWVKNCVKILRKLINKLIAPVIITLRSLPIKTTYKYGANNLNLYPFSLVIIVNLYKSDSQMEGE